MRVSFTPTCAASRKAFPKFSGTNVPDKLEEKPRVNIESPFSGKNPQEREENIEYARALMVDSLLKQGEYPFVMHLLYPQVLNDDIPEQRSLGIQAGLSYRKVVRKSVVGIDRGITVGMAYGMLAAWESGLPVEARSIYGKTVPTEQELKAHLAKHFPEIVARFPTIADDIMQAAGPKKLSKLA